MSWTRCDQSPISASSFTCNNAGTRLLDPDTGSSQNYIALHWATWAPDGRIMAGVRPATPEQRETVIAVKGDGEVQKQLLVNNSPVFIQALAFAPDSRRVAISGFSGRRTRSTSPPLMVMPRPRLSLASALSFRKAKRVLALCRECHGHPTVRVSR